MFNLNLSKTHRHIFSLFVFFILLLSFVFIKMQIRLLGYKVLKTATKVESLKEKLLLKKTKYVAHFSKVQGAIASSDKEQIYGINRKIIYIIGNNTIIDY